MGLQNLIRSYAGYNAWANTKIADWLLTMDEALMYKEIPSSFNSIDNTIQHILRAQKFWVQFVTSKDTTNFDWSVKSNQALDNLKEIKLQSQYMLADLSAFTEENLLEILSLNTPWAKNNLNRFEYIIHVINHSTYHRGQVITIARCLGIADNIPNTDYNFYKIR